ncbi:DNA adenine methylase [Mariniluteicoccus flavus]
MELSDANAELMEFYMTVRDYPDQVHEIASSYRNEKNAYYEIRGRVADGAVVRAARFLYLNHTSFNGIYRVNLRGEYNVPYGFRKFSSIPTLEHLTRAAISLNRAELRAGDFANLTRRARSGGFIFLDPPYTVAHNSNGFVKYNQHLFSFEDQRRLARIIRSLDRRGVSYVLTNAAHESVRNLYPKAQRIAVVTRRNSIGGKGAHRGRAEELLVTNIEGGWLDAVRVG